MLTGINIEATVRLAQASRIPVIASGGLSNMADIENLCAVEDEGIEGVIWQWRHLQRRFGLCPSARSADELGE